MSKPIKWRDIFDFSNPADVDRAIKALKSLNKVYKDLISQSKTAVNQLKANNAALVSSLDSVSKSIIKLDETNNKHQKEIKGTNAQIKAINETFKAQVKQINTLEAQVKRLSREKEKVKKATQNLNESEKETLRLEKQLSKATGENASKNAALALTIREKRKALADEAKVAAGRVTLYQKESARLNDLRNKYKNVALAQGENSRAAKNLLAQLIPLDNQLKRIDASVGQGQRSVGLYGKALGSLRSSLGQVATALGFTGLIFGLVSAFKSAGKTIVGFQKSNAILAGVLNKTRSEITELTEDAKRLGATTAKSANEVSKLQIAYAKLGFEQQEIIDLTGDTINGSIALNAELDETAELTGAMVRTFKDLKTTDAGSILDVLSRSAQLSALNFRKLQTALPIVSGAANAAGVSFERTVSLLAKLSDAGIDASTSSTALRNIFIESAAQGLNYEQILEKISKSQDKLTAANDEFGKRGAVSATILANLSEEVRTFNDDLLNAGGTAKKVADEQLNTLEGKVTLLDSAWKGLILSVESGDGVLSKAAGTIVNISKSFFDVLRSLNEGDIKLALYGETLDSVTKKIEQNSDQQEILRDAIIQFDTALNSGLKTFKAFNKVHGEWFDESERDKALLIEIEKLYKDYNSSIRENIGLTEAQEKSVRKSISSLKVMEVQLKSIRDVLNQEARELSAFNEMLDSILDLEDSTISEWAKEDAKALKDATDQADKYYKAIAEGEERSQLIRETGFEAASIIGNQLFENGRINRENELVDLQAQKDFELQLAGDNAQKKAQIEKKFAQKEKKIRLDQAKAAKKQALFNVTLGTAQAILQAIAQFGPPPSPLGIAGIAAAAVIGTAQTAAILSQPLPAFEKGGEVKTDGAIQVTEKGREMYVDKDGKLGMLQGNKAQVVSGMKGSTILPNPVTEKIMSQGFDHQQINNEASFKINQVLQEQRDNNTRQLISAMQKENDVLIASFAKQIKNIPHDSFNVSDGDLKRVSVKGNTRNKEWRSKNRMS